MSARLLPHQQLAVSQLSTGSILCGGVGSGKSLTALAYYFTVECSGEISESGGISAMARPKDLYIITTAMKRDTLDWERECIHFLISKDRAASTSGVQVTVDSWNNIKRYTKVEDAFFIFDEQRLVGSGAWVKSFLKIAKKNNWILLTATPGDTWMDYVPVFIANGFYKNRTEFIREHVVYNTFTKYPKVDRYIGTGKLHKLRQDIIVHMYYVRHTTSHFENIIVGYDVEKFKLVCEKRWNPFDNKPVREVGEFYYLMRRVVNDDPRRIDEIVKLFANHKRLIVFYNFDYELERLKNLKFVVDTTIAEYNGHNHEPVPSTETWIYLVQYTAGSEGWNCVDTDTIIFYSLNYSYRVRVQASGRINRMNTLFKDLYYYTLMSESIIDKMISKSVLNKKDFNEQGFNVLKELFS